MSQLSYVTIRIRRDISTNWVLNNPVLKLGEPGLETDTRKLKFGDGVTPWTNLGYSGININDSLLLEGIDDRVSSLIKEGSNISINYDDNLNTLTIGAIGLQLAGDYATLVNGRVPAAQLPSYVDDVVEYANLAALPIGGETGKIYVTLDNNKIYRWSGSTYIEISPSPGSTDSVTEGSVNLYYTNSRASAAAPVQNVSGKTGAVTLTKDDVGLGSVDNTSDANKPVSTAQQTALNDKANKTDIHNAAVPWTANHTLADGTRYLANDIVHDGGKIYKAKFDNESIPTSNTTYWEDIGAGYRLNIDGRDISNIPYPITGVSGRTGNIVLTKDDVGLGNVNNTSDTNKPVSTAQATADGAVQAHSIQRSNHTGTQTASTISDFSISASAAAPVQSVNGSTGIVTIDRLVKDSKTVVLGSNGSLTFPSGSILSETNNTLSLMPPTAQTGQSLVVRPTAALWAISSSNYIEYGNPITIVVTLQSWAYFGTVNYTISGTGVTPQSLGRTLTGKLTFVSTTGPDAESITWTIPANSDISEFTLTLTSVDGTRSTDQETQNDPTLYYSFEESNGMPIGQFITVTNNGISSSEHSHVHLVAGNPETVDIYLGDDDQYIKIEKDGGDVVVGTNSNTNHWIFDNDGNLTLPVSGSIIFPDNTTQNSANISSSNITDFNTSVSGLLPVKDIVAGTDISINSSSGIYTINSTVGEVAQAASLVTTVFNKTASTINKGRVVYINGGQGDQPTIQLAIAVNDSGSSKTYGITAENISSMSLGKVIVAGALTGINTDIFNPTAPAGNVNGSTLYLSPTSSGTMTIDKPVAPDHMVSVGTVVRTHQNEGVIEVRVQNGFELEELHNVAVSGVTNGQFLQYNSGSGLWIASSSGTFTNLNVSNTGDIDTLKINKLYHQNLSIASGINDTDMVLMINNPSGTPITQMLLGSTLRNSLLNQPAQLQFRQGTDIERLLITPASGEPIWTTDSQKFYIGDGTTVGGDLIGGPYSRGTGTGSVVVDNSGCTASAQYSTVGGGEDNTATSSWGTVSGGKGNTAASTNGGYNTVGGGQGNIANGDRNTVGGGYSNQALGFIANVVAGGRNNIAGYNYGDMDNTVGGGYQNRASGSQSTVAGGHNNSTSGYHTTVGGGYYNNASGNYSTVGGGGGNNASGYASTVPGGVQAKASRYGELSHAAGKFANIGDAQHTILVARRTTTNATANQVLFLDDSSARLTLPPETTWTFTIKLSAYNDTDNEGGWWIFRGGIRRNAANGTALIGSLIIESGFESSLNTASTSVVADDTNEALEIRVTGVASKNIRWVAVVDISQVSYGTP